ncbi:MAG: amidophosphoribosyltransferase, partial [Nitrospinae bacterium]|nr:amidophosphoribosyltransferase [Nitrospinota bacterium]
FKVLKMNGSHMIGHTRMATESAVTTEGAHPFNTGSDLCLVHNGSLSNHNDLRKWLFKEKGIVFQTENDSEVAAGYISYKMVSD